MLMAMMAIPFAMQAQTKFHDVELNEATGPVKSITQAGMMGRGEQVVNFNQEGKMQAEGLSGQVYDADGYLQKVEREFESPAGQHEDYDHLQVGERPGEEPGDGFRPG